MQVRILPDQKNKRKNSMVQPIKTTDKSGWEGLSSKKARSIRARDSQYIYHDDIYPHNYYEPPSYIRKVY